MWGALGKILGGESVIEKGFSLIDSMHTSDVEMIEAKTKAKTDLMAAYAPFKVAQRYIALMFTLVFLSSFILVLVMTLTGRGETVGVMSVLDEFYIGQIMLCIVAFYFGGGAIEGTLKARGGGL